ncbi:MAG: hypothetical protein IH881_18115 [Myxococcales bacterium]|nr:hypothetical protein [Myxococcales bacterium]
MADVGPVHRQKDGFDAFASFARAKRLPHGLRHDLPVFEVIPILKEIE